MAHLKLWRGGVVTLLLHPKGVGSLRVEVRCIFVLFGFTTEQAEAAAGAGGCFVCLSKGQSGRIVG